MVLQTGQKLTPIRILYQLNHNAMLYQTKILRQKPPKSTLTQPKARSTLTFRLINKVRL